MRCDNFGNMLMHGVNQTRLKNQMIKPVLRGSNNIASPHQCRSG